MNMLKKIQNKNIAKVSIVAAVMVISTVLSNIVASNAAVETVVPPGATMDVFDYYVMGKNTDQNYECYSHPEIATNGINAGKQLKFLYNNAVRNHSYDATTAKWVHSVRMERIRPYHGQHRHQTRIPEEHIPNRI